VFLGTHKKTGLQRAIKVLQKSGMSKDEMSNLNEEVHILSEMDHPNIVKLYDFYNEKTTFSLVQEVVPGGELFDAITGKDKVSLHDTRELISTMLETLNYFHGKGIIHRDLKPENILLEGCKDFKCAKIIDFGIAAEFDGRSKLNEEIGTPFYMAPEVMTGKYDEKCDVWSLGVICYMVLTGTPPFYGENNEEIKQKILKGTPNYKTGAWKNIPTIVKDFVKAMLTVDPEKRPTAAECLQLKWIRSQKEVVMDPEQEKAMLAKLQSFNAN